MLSRVLRVLGDSSEANAFLYEVQYPRFLDGRDLETLESLFAFESDENQKATLLFDAIHFLMNQGQNRVRQTSPQALMALNAFSRGQEHAANTRKFRPLQSPKSVQKYTHVFRAFMIFLLNTFRFQGDTPRQEGPASLQHLWQPRPIDLKLLETLQATLDRARPRALERSTARALPPATWQDGLDSDSDLGSEVDNDEAPVSTAQPTGQFSSRTILEVAKQIQELCISLMQRPLGDYFDDPLYAFLACYSRDYAKGCFKFIGVISQVYSAVIKTFQFLFLDYTHQNISPNQLMAREITAFMFNHFTVQSESPLGMVLDHRKFALFLNRNSSTPGLVTLIRPHTLLYRQKSISQQLLQSFLHQTLKDLALGFANDLFLQFNFFQEIWPSISLQESARFEEFANSTLGFSFLSNLQNSRYYTEFLIRKIMGSDLRDIWFQKDETEGVKLRIIPQQAYSYLGLVARFQRILLALCHMTSGAPARGTEINQILLQNTAITSRHLFLDPKSAQFLIRIAYSKTFSRTGQERNAIRVLPQVLSEILLGFLLVIRPFLGFLTLDLEQAPIDLDHLWVDYSSSRVISSKALSDTMKRLSLENLGFSIGLSSWRHIAQAFIRYVQYIYISLDLYIYIYLSLPLKATYTNIYFRYGMQEDPSLDSLDDELDDEGLGALQMHHSRQTGQMVYGRQAAQVNHLGQDQQTALVEFSRRWHAYLGLAPQQTCLHSLVWPRTKDLEPQTSQTVTLEAPTVTFPLAQPLVQFCFPRKEGSQPPEAPVSVGLFHQALGFLGQPERSRALESDLAGPTDLDQAQAIHIGFPETPRGQTLSLNPSLLGRVLQDFFQDQQAEFRTPEQMQALQLLLQKVPYLLMILPTAGGKTTLFLLGASLTTSKTTILVVPLLSLKRDLYQKAQAIGLSISYFEETYEESSNPRILLVSIETLGQNPRFLEHAFYLKHQGLLDRLIFDECHLIPLSAHYRKAMWRARQAMALEVPTIFASATLPDHLEEDLYQKIGLGVKPYVFRVKGSINQPTLSYRVQEMPQQAELGPYLMQSIQNYERKLGKPLQTLVFCMSKHLVNELHENYDQVTAYFHADLDEDTKTSELQRFLQKKCAILLATGAIGAGYDFPSIDLVIHLQGAYGLTDFLQESGRASRTPGRLGVSICLVRPSDRIPRENDSRERSLFRDYLNETLCRRRSILRIFNGQAIESCDPTWVLCDLCKKRALVHQQVAQATSHYYQNASKAYTALLEALELWWNQRCLACYIRCYGQSFLKNQRSRKY